MDLRQRIEEMNKQLAQLVASLQQRYYTEEQHENKVLALVELNAIRYVQASVQQILLDDAVKVQA